MMNAERTSFISTMKKFGPYLSAPLFMIAGVIAAVHLSYLQAERDLFAQVSFIAGEVVQRSEIVSDQMMQATNILDARGDPDPCSAANIDIMRRENMGSSYLQLIGYVHDNRLMCSSYGRHGSGIDLGPPTYVSAANFAIRTKVKTPLDETGTYVTSTHVTTGMTVFVLPNLALDVAKSDKGLALGLYGTANGIPILDRGEVQNQWMHTDLEKGATRQFVTAEHVVALIRSDRYQIVAYCAFPIARLYGAWRAYARFFVPLGILVGLCLSGLMILFARRHLGLRYQLREAIKSETQLYMLYQPIVELESGRWIGAESLVRWRHGSGQIITPDVFIPIAEITGLMPRLTAKIVEMVVKDLSQFLKNYSDFHININFAASDLESGLSLDQLHRQLHHFGIDESRITVEVTEGSLLKIDYARRNMRLMRESGLQIAIDDFGTGYCGLSYLVSLDLDYLKIDKSFVDSIGTDAATRSVVPHIVQMAKTLGLEVVAEGVERQDQVDFLRQQGVKYAQGWLYSKALPIAELSKKIAEGRRLQALE
ncbi:EAL domain-containing protein [Oxalobacteraceae bacterium CAVE-383]|nr:EAL domain-containing protein [Oxalobacteraceae bacterium CAVE-383]